MSKNIVIIGDSNSNHTIKWAKGIQSSGYNVTVISCGGRKIDRIETINFGNISGGLRNFLQYKNQVQRQIVQLNPNLIHTIKATGEALWGGVKIDCVKLLTPLGSDIAQTRHKNFIYKWFVNKVLKEYDWFSTASHFLKNDMNLLYPVTIGKVDVIPFGVEIREEQKRHKKTDSIRLVFLKHLVPGYGPDVLLKAIAIVKKQKLQVHLDFYGDTKYGGWVMPLVKELDISDVVTFKGWLEMELISKALLDYDIMVMPSRSESFGVAALDAAAVGLPVVATKVGGIPEIIENNITGLLVSPDSPEALAEAIIKLIENVELRKKMGESAREKVLKMFNWKDNLADMVRLYERLIADRENV